MPHDTQLGAGSISPQPASTGPSGAQSSLRGRSCTPRRGESAGWYYLTGSRLCQTMKDRMNQQSRQTLTTTCVGFYREKKKKKKSPPLCLQTSREGDQKAFVVLPKLPRLACKTCVQYKDMPVVQPMQPPGVGNLKKYIPMYLYIYLYMYQCP